MSIVLMCNVTLRFNFRRWKTRDFWIEHDTTIGVENTLCQSQDRTERTDIKRAVPCLVCFRQRNKRHAFCRYVWRIFRQSSWNTNNILSILRNFHESNVNTFDVSIFIQFNRLKKMTIKWSVCMKRGLVSQNKYGCDCVVCSLSTLLKVNLAGQTTSCNTFVRVRRNNDTNRNVTVCRNIFVWLFYV